MDENCIEALLIERDAGFARDLRDLLSEYAASDGLQVRLTRKETAATAIAHLSDARVDVVLLGDSGIGPETRGSLRTLADLPIVLLNGCRQHTEVGRHLHVENCLPRRELNALMLGRTLQQAVERRRLKQLVAEQAERDPVTGLPNRQAFLGRLESALQRANRDGTHFAVLFLDLDHFKKINDSLGHDSGDRFLRDVGQALTECIHADGVVSRFGGDEFALLVEGVTDAAAAADVARRVDRRLRTPVTQDDHEIVGSVSIGIVLSSLEYSDAGEILRDAEIAMYRAKAAGRSDYQIFDREMREWVVEKLQLERALRQAVAEGSFQLAFQPIVKLPGEEIVGFEALIRWQHPEWGFVSPAKFIPVAEESGLIVSIGRWVLREACAQMQTWKRAFPQWESLRLSVNLSSRELPQPDLLDQIDAILGESGFAADCLELEITESAVIENDETAAAVFDGLKERGISLSIDDFGMGYSSLSYLHRFAFDTLKIDRSFVSRMGEGEQDSEVFVQTIITLASTLGMRVVGEGVETVEQKDSLSRLGCDFGQGYLFSRPLDGDAMTALLAQAEPSRRETVACVAGE